MGRFFVPRANINCKSGKITVRGKEAHHIIKVMRAKKGKEIVLFDDSGNEYTSRIEKINSVNNILTAGIVKKQDGPPPGNNFINLVQAIPKHNKMDYIVEKATELGVGEITPVITERTIVRPEMSLRNSKVSRWNRIAMEAAKQCSRPKVPQVSDIDLYGNIVKKFRNYDLVLMATLSGYRESMENAMSSFKNGKIMIVIGPEGDFTEDEIRISKTNNVRLITLGNRVLKSDTAGLFVLSVLAYKLGV